MEKNNNLIWDLPTYFFIFLTIFIFIKFIFIFFFRSAYEPQILFELTPLHLLSGINNLQLLFLSLVIIFFDMYLHLNRTKKNLTYSFLVTALICSGIVLAIASRELGISDVYHYLLFGCILTIILIDHRFILTMPGDMAASKKESPKSAKTMDKTVEKTPMLRKGLIIKIFHISFKKHLGKLYKLLPFTRTSKTKSLEKVIKNPSNPMPDSRFHIRKSHNKNEKITQSISQELIDLDEKRMSKAEIMLSEIEEKTDKLIALDKEIKSSRNYLNEQERRITRQILSSLKREKLTNKQDVQKTPTEIKKYYTEEDEGDYLESFREIKDYAAIIQEGIFKQVKNSLATLIGYSVNEIVNKKLSEFISPDSYYEVGKYYISKLKGEEISSYNVTLLTKNNEKLDAKVNISSIVYEGKKAELAIFKINKK